LTSAANVGILLAVHGQELGWVCLLSCTTDVTINALALFFVTGSYDEEQERKHIETMTAQTMRHYSDNAQPRILKSATAEPGTYSSLVIHQ
jgi:hypothetical protein